MAANLLALLVVLLSCSAGAAEVWAEDPETLLQQELEDVLNESQYARAKKEYKADHNELQMAFCVIDAIQAAVSLGQAGVGIAEATKTCKPVKDPVTGNYAVPKGSEAACAETITFIITTFGHVAVFLSGAASQCAKSINFGAYCAVDVADIVTGLSLLAESGSSMAANCQGGADYNKDDPANADAADGRRLAEAKSDKERGVTIATCVFDVLQAAMFLARAGAIIEEVVYTCQESERLQKIYRWEHNASMDAEDIVERLKRLSKLAAQDYIEELEDAREAAEAHGWHPWARRLRAPLFNVTVKDTKHSQRICAVNVLHLISSFAYVASFLSYAAAKCPEVKNYNAACAGGIINTITGLTIVAASGLDIENSCGLLGKNETSIPHSEENPTARRLSQSTKELMALVV